MLDLNQSKRGYIRISSIANSVIIYFIISIVTFLSTIAPSVLKEGLSRGRGKQLKKMLDSSKFVSSELLLTNGRKTSLFNPYDVESAKRSRIFQARIAFFCCILNACQTQFALL